MIQVDLELSSVPPSGIGSFRGDLENLLVLDRYCSKGHGQRELCAGLSLLEQQFYFSLSALVKVKLSIERDSKKGLCLIKRESQKSDGFFLYGEHTLLSSFLLGLDLLVAHYEDDIFVKVGGRQCHQKKVKVLQTTTEIVSQSI